MRFHSSLRAVLLTFLVMLLPQGVAAAPSGIAEAVWSRPTVSRATFVRAAVQTLRMPISATGQPRESYGRPVPKTIAPYVYAAEQQHALDGWETHVYWSQPVTRGEAVQMMSAFVNAVPLAEEVRFADVKPATQLATAVTIALEQSWMRPLRPSRFGVRVALTGREARQLLERAAGYALPTEDTAPSVHIRVLPPQIAEGDILQTVRHILKERFLYEERLDTLQKPWEDAAALVESLQDPYTVYMPPADAQEFNVQLEGEVTGIGAQVEMIGDVLTIVSPLTGSPAEKAGLRGGDRIIGVDHQNIRGLSLLEAVAKVRGPQGASVLLRIQRDGQEFDVTVLRARIQVPEIEIGMQDGIAMIKLLQFGQITDSQLRMLLTQLQQEYRPRGLILDMRNNPGGLLHAAEIVLSNFLPKGTGIARILSRDSAFTQTTTDPPTIDPSVPMAVLVNHGSASASEIVAGALQDAQRATIIGEQTFGKGTVQQILEFRDGSSIKLTIAEWRTPADRTINDVGIVPDITVIQPADRDAQLQHAMDLLR